MAKSLCGYSAVRDLTSTSMFKLEHLRSKGKLLVRRKEGTVLVTSPKSIEWVSKGLGNAYQLDM